MDDARRADVELWIRKARDDLEVARLVLDHSRPAAVGCFLCQQAAEKALKARLLAAGAAPPRVHDLERLVRLLETAGAPVAVDPDRLAALAQYAVAPRYPGFPDDRAEQDLAALVAFTEQLVETVEASIRSL